MKISEAAALFYKSKSTVVQDSTIVWYKKKLNHLIAYLEDREVSEINIFDLENFRDSLNRGSHAPGRSGKVTAYTIHGYIRALKTFFHFLKKRKLIQEDPSEDLDKPRLPKQQRKGILPEAAGKMINVAKVNPRDYAILLFARDTACRAGGIYNLLTDNLDIRHNRAIVREKGDKERVVFFTNETSFALIMYATIRKNPHGDEHFFLSDRTFEPLSYSGVYQIFKRCAKASHISTKYSPHQWRHASARAWIKSGMNLKIVSEILGHGSEKVTGDIYGTLDEMEIQSIYNYYNSGTIPGNTSAFGPGSNPVPWNFRPLA